MNPGGWRRVEAPALAALGAVQTLSFTWTWSWPLPLLTLSLLVWRLDAAKPARAAVLGWCYGTAWLLASTWWLFISLHHYGGLPALLAAAAVFSLSAALSLYLAAACAAYARWRSGGAADAVLFGSAWLLAELARALIFTGFPWAASGYSQVDAPLAALAPFVGVYGIGAVLAGLAAAAVHMRRPRTRLAGLVAVAAVLGLATGRPVFTAPAGDIDVALLQTRVSQDEKFAADRMPESLAWVAREMAAAQADLVVAPETAVPLLPAQLEAFAPGYWAALKAPFDRPDRAALVGVPLGDYDSGYTNSVVGFSAGPDYRYDKQHLVPFGEFIPTGFRWFTEMMNIPLGDFNRGVANPPSFAVRGQRVAPNICYEDLFGEELARRFTVAATAPTMFANVSNIGWFGDTVAVPQHLHISRMRTLEFQLPMLRSTNTGATAVVDHHGVVTAQLPPTARGVLQARVQGREGRTPFAFWAANAGAWPLVGVALAVVAGAAASGRRRHAGRSGAHGSPRVGP